jgi:nucleoside-diphosphate-sugar epimerase
MKLVLFGTGMIGSRILSEALMRGHSVTIVKRDLKTFTPTPVYPPALHSRLLIAVRWPILLLASTSGHQQDNYYR